MLQLLRGNLKNATDLGIDDGAAVVVAGRAAVGAMVAEAEKESKELEDQQQKCIVEIRAAIRADDRDLILKLLRTAQGELKMTEDQKEVAEGRAFIEGIKAQERLEKLGRQQQVKQCFGEIRTAKRKGNMDMLAAAIAKAASIGVDETSPDILNGKALLQQMQLANATKRCRIEIRAAVKAGDLKRLQRVLKTSDAIEFAKQDEEELDEEVIAQQTADSELLSNGRAVCESLQKDAQQKMASNFIKNNGFGSRDWMGKAKAAGHKFEKQPATELQLVDVEQELWMVFTHYSVRFNAKELGVMRKDAFMALMRDCNLVSMKEVKGKVMEADMNTIHGVVSSQTKGRKFLFGSFKKAIGKIAAKVYPKEKAQVAMERLLSEGILPHAAKRMRVSIDEQLTDPEILLLEKSFAPSLKDIFQFFAVMPTDEERKDLGRHKPRGDIDEFIGQSLTYDRFMQFSSVFSLSSGTGMVHAALTNTDLAAVFLDTIRVQRVDAVGGLTFEEFWEALARLALVFYTRRGVENRAVLTAKKVRALKKKESMRGGDLSKLIAADGSGGGGAGAEDEEESSEEDEDEGESETVYETIVHLMLWLHHNLDNAVPRAISSQEQFIFGKAEISLSNRGHCLQRGADAFRRKAETLEREMTRTKALIVMDPTAGLSAGGDVAAAGLAGGSELMVVDTATMADRAETERQLWAVFTNATVHSADPEVMRRDALMNLLRDCNIVKAKSSRPGVRGAFGLIDADVYAIHRALTSKHPDGRFKFSCFKKGLAKAAEKLYARQTKLTLPEKTQKLVHEQVRKKKKSACLLMAAGLPAS